MKVFNGKEFLEQKAAQLDLSNGLTVTVTDIDDAVMDKLSEFESNSNVKVSELKTIFAQICGCDVKELSNVGIVELRGALDFLTGSLFNTE